MCVGRRSVGVGSPSGGSDAAQALSVQRRGLRLRRRELVSLLRNLDCKPELQ